MQNNDSDSDSVGLAWDTVVSHDDVDTNDNFMIYYDLLKNIKDVIHDAFYDGCILTKCTVVDLEEYYTGNFVFGQPITKHVIRWCQAHEDILLNLFNTFALGNSFKLFSLFAFSFSGSCKTICLVTLQS